MHNFEGVTRKIIQVRNLIIEISQLQILLIKFSILYIHLDDFENIR